MKNYKRIIHVGGATIAISFLIRIYSFIDMYSLVEKCAKYRDAQLCQAYTNWTTLNTIGSVILAIGIVILAIGLLKRYKVHHEQ